MKQAGKIIWTLMSKEEQSVMSVGIAILQEIITMVPCFILQLLNANLGVTVKVSFNPEISRYKGWLGNTFSHSGATRQVSILSVNINLWVD